MKFYVLTVCQLPHFGEKLTGKIGGKINVRLKQMPINNNNIA